MAAHHEDRLALRCQLVEQPVHLDPGADIDAAGGLVEQEDVGAALRGGARGRPSAGSRPERSRTGCPVELARRESLPLQGSAAASLA